jgi:hypothetical protein
LLKLVKNFKIFVTVLMNGPNWRAKCH